MALAAAWAGILLRGGGGTQSAIDGQPWRVLRRTCLSIRTAPVLEVEHRQQMARQYCRR